MPRLEWDSLARVLESEHRQPPADRLEMARRAWDDLAGAGFTDYATPRERLGVIARAIALARIVTRGIPQEPWEMDDEDLAHWASLLGAAQSLVADEVERLGGESWGDPFDEFEENIGRLVERELAGVVDRFFEALRQPVQIVHAVGMDLAWSPANPTGLAAATVSEEVVTIIATARAESIDEITAFVRRFATSPVTVAIDAPTVVPHEDRMRECEKILHRDRVMQAARAGPYPGTRRLLGQCNGGVPRGEELVKRLREELEFCEVGCPEPRHSGRFAMEVFPAAAMVRLFDLRAPLPYKKKGKRTWEQCQAGLSSYISRLRALQHPRLALPDDLAVNGQRGKVFKDLEDRVDAVLCAYVAALAWLGQAECVGTVEDGYIVLPRERDNRRQ